MVSREVVFSVILIVLFRYIRGGGRVDVFYDGLDLISSDFRRYSREGEFVFFCLYKRRGVISDCFCF